MASIPALLGFKPAGTLAQGPYRERARRLAIDMLKEGLTPAEVAVLFQFATDLLGHVRLNCAPEDQTFESNTLESRPS